MPEPLFRDRHDAGRKLAKKLMPYEGLSNLYILALSGGGIAVAYGVAKELKAPLDIFVVRNLPVPGLEQLSMGVVVSGGATVFNQNVTRPLDISNKVIDEAVIRERAEIARLEQIYHPERSPYDLENKHVILVDDGLTTGTMMADAVTGMRDLGALRVIIAIPTAMPETYASYDRFDENDTIICAEPPNAYRTVENWYGKNFAVEDEDIRRYLESAALR